MSSPKFAPSTAQDVPAVNPASPAPPTKAASIDTTAGESAAAPGTGSVACVIEMMHQGVLYGHVLHTAKLSAPLRLALLDGGVLLRQFAPDPEPADRAGSEDGKRYFQVPIPQELFDGKSHDFSVQVRDDAGTVLARAALTQSLPKAGGKTRQEPVKGHADGIQGPFVEGWAYDPEDPDTPVAVEILCDGVAVTRGVANRSRNDLIKAGMGASGFHIRIPTSLFAAHNAVLQVRETRTGTLLPGPQLSLEVPAEIEAQITGVEGAFVVGWVHDPGLFGAAPEVEIWVDGEQADRCVASEMRVDGNGHIFRSRLPDKFLDARPHEIFVSMPSLNRTVATSAVIIPASLTPIEGLQRYAGNAYLKGYLSPIGPLRYESLRKSLKKLHERAQHAKGNDTAAILRDISRIALGHDQVIRGFEDPYQQNFEPIDFSAHDKPKVSIVIPVHNKFGVTYNCLASIAAADNNATYEVIVVDDGSTDQTTEIAGIVNNVTVVRHKAAQGFVGACNAGGEKARGEYIVMLNNDTEVMSGWLDELLEPFSRFDKVGMTGAKLIYPDGRLQEAGGIVWGDGQPWNVGRNGNARDPRYNYSRQVDYLSGACLMLPTALWKTLGGFDRHFAPAYYEDTDLAFRVRAAGFRTVYTPFCEVIHYEGVSNGTSTAGSGLKRFQAINEPKFKARWILSYRNNGLLGRDAAHVVQDRNVVMRALVLDAQTLTPDMDAGSYSATQELRLLQSLGFKVTFVPANLAYMGGYTEALQRMGVEVLYAPFVNSMQEVIEQRGPEFDLIYIARYGVAEPVIDTIREKLPRAKVILNIHDLHFLREIREALLEKNPELMQKAIATRDAELALMRKVDLVVSYSPVEHAVIQSHNLDSTKVASVPWVVEAADKVPPFDARKDIAFLGGFGHRPNAEGVEWFVKEVMPLLRHKLPGARFLIYGSKAPDSLKALLATDIVLKGFVKSTEEVYDGARVFVSPLLSGAGLKGKVVGAFARGIPQVMTPTAAEATGAANGQHAMIVSKPADWADAVAKLYNDRAAWERMSQLGLQLAREEYSFAKGQEVMLQALHTAGALATSQNETLWSKCPIQ